MYLEWLAACAVFLISPETPKNALEEAKAEQTRTIVAEAQSDSAIEQLAEFPD